jgi:DNA-binding response OmpR family regulator
MSKKLLLIDDDLKLVQRLTQYLTGFEIEVKTTADSEAVMGLISRERPDLVLLDVMLPGKNGFEVCKDIRKSSSVPIIMLTARGEVTDRIIGLELGADDYLAKPFEPRELLARINSVLRRLDPPTTEKVLKFGELEIDLEKRATFLKGKLVELTTMEYETLVLFATRPGKTLTRDQIIEHLRGGNWEAFDRSIDVLMSRLRQKLNDNPKNPSFFKTVWGNGYVFIGGQSLPSSTYVKAS